MISKVKKLQKLTKKKVQLILTNRPKLICVDPSKLMVKPDVIWSDNPNDLSIHVTSSSHFKISTVSSRIPTPKISVDHCSRKSQTFPQMSPAEEGDVL